MKSAVTELYYRCPDWLQTMLISAYGYKVERIRHGGDYRNIYREIIGQAGMSAEALGAFQGQKLSALLKSARDHVPYYTELFRDHDIDVDRIGAPEDLSAVPLLEKETLRKRTDDFVDKRFKSDRLQAIHTTGTTGTPLKVYCNPIIRRLNYAYFQRFLESVGINYNGVRGTFGGRVVVAPDRKKPPFWKYSFFQKNMLYSSYHLTDDNMGSYIDGLGRLRPDYIDAYPSSLFTIARYAADRGIDLSGVTKGIITSAETLFPSQRRVIESVFGLPVFDQYGTAEMCVFASQCSEGNYHVHTDYGIVEFLREDGTPAEPGEEAEVVCTGFINHVMPLIRYRVGDYVLLSERKCACGSVFPVVDKIAGRRDDVVLTPDGRKVGRLSPVMKGVPVKEVQYVQDEIASLTVKIVKSENFTAKTEGSIEAKLRERLGNEIALKFEYSDSIERGPGGKLRNIVSSISRAGA